MNRSVKIFSFLGLVLAMLSFSFGCSSSQKVGKGLPEEKILKKEDGHSTTSEAANSNMLATPTSQGEHGNLPADKGSSHATEWSYSGMTGPQFWGDLDPQFHLCKTGTDQSPVDLRWKRPAQNRLLEITYKTSPLKIIDNGHTIQVNAASGNYLKIDGTQYELKQIHFHAPSEHTFSGKHYPMEMHFVHQAENGKLAVLGRMMSVGTKANPFIEKIWANIPKAKNQEVAVASETIDFDLALPKSKTYYNYSGSLTTPPCTENIDWNVLNTPLKISKAQLAAFQSIYKNNSRPVQQINNRKPANY